MKEKESRTEAAMHELRKFVIDLSPNMGKIALELLDAHMRLIASSALVDHFNDQIQSK